VNWSTSDGRYSIAVRAELLAMSPATIDRYLRPAKATDQIRGASTTKPSPLLRSSIKIRKAGDEAEAEPGFFEGDTVAHCGPTLRGEFARTLTDLRAHPASVLCATASGVAARAQALMDTPAPRRSRPVYLLVAMLLITGILSIGSILQIHNGFEKAELHPDLDLVHTLDTTSTDDGPRQ
jgi:hypothetical protein